MQLLPLKAPSYAGAWQEVLNRTGVGPTSIDLSLGKGTHTLSVEYACDGVGSSRVVTRDGRAMLDVIAKPSGARCTTDFTYGTKFKVSRSGQHLRLIVRPSMRWALQIWAQ